MSGVDKILVKASEAAQMVSMSEATIKRAIRTTDPASFPPPLKAKRGGKGEYLIAVAELHRWAARLDDA
jgi:hypothetical protein